MLAKQLLAEAGKEVSADALREALTTKQYNNLCNVFRQSMSPQAKNDYKELKTDDERRQWTAAFVLDPALVAAEGFKRTSVFKSETNVEDEMWLTLDQLQGPQFLNSKDHALALVEAGELEERPHEFSSLAQRGIKQYRFSVSMLRREHGSKEENGTRCSSDLTAKEYTQVSGEMSKGFGRTPKRKMTKPKEPENEDSKRLRVATQNRATAIRKCKTFIDKCAGDASSCEADLSKPKLQTFPEAMTSWLLQRIQEFQAVIREAQQGYAAEATRIEGTRTLDEVRTGKTTIDGVIGMLETAYRAFKEGVMADVKKLAS